MTYPTDSGGAAGKPPPPHRRPNHAAGNPILHTTRDRAMTRSELNGVFFEDDLSRLTWPIAWSGTVPQAEREEREADLLAFVAEAREAIRECLGADAVEVEAGEIVGVKLAEECDECDD